MWENDYLDEGMAEDLRREYMGTRLGRQELEGEMLGDFEGALISRDDLDKYRIPRESIPLLSRVVIGVDPAMKAGEDHDESGIVVAGEAAGPDGELHAFIIDDRSFRGTPNQVMQQVAAAVRKWEADCVVLETNQGGQWVRDTLRTVDSGIPVREVHAMKNKVLRAERVSALFEQGKIHMAGTFPELEDELCQLMPGEVPVPQPGPGRRRGLRDLRAPPPGAGRQLAVGLQHDLLPELQGDAGRQAAEVPRMRSRAPAGTRSRRPRADGEPKGWAAAYAPRQPVNQVDQVAAMLRQYAQGNFSGASAGSHPGPGRDLEEGMAVTPPSAGMPCRHCGTVTENAVVIYGRDRAGALLPRAAQCRDGCTRQAPARQGRGQANQGGNNTLIRSPPVTKTAIRPGRCCLCERDILPGDVLAQSGDEACHYECAPAEEPPAQPQHRERARTRRA